MTQQQTLLPYPVLPLERTEPLPQMSADTLVLVVGGRGIAKAVALQFHALGATVSVTTRNLKTYDRSGLPPEITLFELDYTRCGLESGSPRSFIHAYVATFGRVWQVRHDGAMTVYAGDPLDYSEGELEKVMQMYFLGPMLLERLHEKQVQSQRELAELLDRSDELERQYCTIYGMSTAAFTQPPFFQPIYNARHTYCWNQIVGRNASKKQQNHLYLGVACTFTQTEWYKQVVNPSAKEGDHAQEAYDEITAKMTPQIGVPTETIGLAVAQAFLLREQLEQETIFVVPDKGGAASQAGSGYLAQIRTLSAKKQTEAYVDFVKNSFHIDIQDH